MIIISLKGRSRRQGSGRGVRPLALASLSLLAAAPGFADTTISAAQSTAVQTSTGGNITIDSGGSVNPSSGAAVTINSSNTVDNEGSITINNANNATGILAIGGNTGSITVGGTINITDSPAASTIPLTSGVNRYDIWVDGSTPFTGSINQTAGVLEVRGNNSASILISSGGMTGNIIVGGTIAVSGNNSYGIQTLGSAGTITVTGGIAITGTGSGAISLGGALTGDLEIDSGVRATGYFTDGSAVTGRPTTLTGLTANQLLQGGPTVQVMNSVAGGILLGNSGTISSFGSAAALSIAPTSVAATIGVYDPTSFSNGVLIEGLIRGNGIYDNFNATGVQIGGGAGSVTIDGGLRVSSTGHITARAFAADATAISIGSGANIPSITNVGTIDAVVLYGANANATTGGTATAILQTGGSLASITNTAIIRATTASGNAVAMNLQGDASSIVVTQSAAPAGSTTTPSITGDILFGSNGAALNVDAGTVTGNVTFGSGANSLTIAGGGQLTGALTTSGPTTAVSVTNGQLTLTGSGSAAVSTLQIGSAGEINFAANPITGQNAKLDPVDAVLFSNGAKVGLDFSSRLVSPETFTIIQATPGSISNPSALSVGDVSYFYVTSLQADNANGTVALNVRDRTFAEAGVLGNAAAYNAISSVFSNDTQILQAFNNASSRQSFSSLYNQMLPFYSGGLFEVLQKGASAVLDAQGNGPVALASDRTGGWFQAIGFGADKGTDSSPGYYGGGLGLAFGWETPASTISTLGVSFSYMRGSVTQTGEGSDSRDVGSSYNAGVYWRENDGPLRLNASLNAGIAQFNSDRDFNANDATGASFNRTASSAWVGGLGLAHIGLGYEVPISDNYYVRPQALADYFVMYEESHKEHNGGDSFDLKIGSALGKQGSVEGSVALGANFDDDHFIWKPEVTMGWKQVFGGPDDTMAQFNTGSPFILSPKAQEGGAVARLGVHGGNQYSDVALEAGGEDRGQVRSVDAQFVGRIKF